MKCENCGKNEVTFVYHSSINGAVTEKHLCSACAEALGYAQTLRDHSLFRDAWNESLFGPTLLDGFFPPRLSLLGRMREDPFDDFFAEMPALRAPAPAEKKQEELLDAEERSRIGQQRQLNALRLALQEAVRREEFERAARLRDEIRELEGRKESA